MCKLREPDSIISINYLFPLCWQINESQGCRPGWKHETLYTQPAHRLFQNPNFWIMYPFKFFTQSECVNLTQHASRTLSNIFKCINNVNFSNSDIKCVNLFEERLDAIWNLNGLRKHVIVGEKLYVAWADRRVVFPSRYVGQWSGSQFPKRTMTSATVRNRTQFHAWFLHFYFIFTSTE